MALGDSLTLKELNSSIYLCARVGRIIEFQQTHRRVQSEQAVQTANAEIGRLVYITRIQRIHDIESLFSWRLARR
jgi:hypothetical protein